MIPHLRKCFNLVIGFALSTIIAFEDSENPTAEQFFYDDTDSFFNLPTTPKLTFEENVEQFFDEPEGQSIFKKEKDVFEKMKADEEFFFKSERMRNPSDREQMDPSEPSTTVTQGSRYCNCDGLYCGCCYCIKFYEKERFRGCFEMEYRPDDFAIFMSLSINNRTLITRVLSGRNPLPFCAKTIYVPLVSFCIRLYDIHHNPHGVSLCLRLEVTSMRQILFSISFDCINIDNHKISFLVPPNATTFGLVGLHLGDTDPYLSYNDWTKLHFPLPDIPTSSVPTTLSTRKHHFLWFK